MELTVRRRCAPLNFRRSGGVDFGFDERFRRSRRSEPTQHPAFDAFYLSVLPHDQLFPPQRAADSRVLVYRTAIEGN